MLVGPPNGGKTYMYNLLSKSINAIMHLINRGEGAEEYHINTDEFDLDKD